MKNMTLIRAAQACEGRLCGAFDPNQELGRLVIDSRFVEPGDLFAAYRGEKADGHDYISSAFDRGAACCLAERVPEGETRPILLVPAVQHAIERIAAEYRRDLTIPLIGITGSVGKTSAKEMIASVLEQRFRVLKTDKNLNNQIGVPMTISRIEPCHQIAVVEMGISKFGDMQVLAEIARPTIAVFTVIGHAHLEFLGDREGVFRAKTEMLESMDDNAVVLVNGDDDLLRDLRCRQRRITFGLGENCDVRAVDLELDGNAQISCVIRFADRRIPVTIPAFGKHMIYAALEGVAVGLLLGLSDDEIRKGIAAFSPVGRRFAISKTPKITLIDDCYNANPDSVKCGIDSLLELSGRHVCILGDMLELGSEERKMHRDVGRYAAEKGIDLLLCCGPLSREIAKGAGSIALWFDDLAALIADLPSRISAGDCVLVKASRAMRFEQIAEALKLL